jgi:Alternative complex III, ActD subunit
MHQDNTAPKLFGLLAEFDSATAIVAAARKTREAGFTKIDAYTPFPIHQLDDALKLRRTGLPWLVFGGGLTGMLGGFALQYWAAAIEYPLNIGGRPLASWPAFVIPAYETTILLASITAVVGMIALNGLPMPYHPVFNVPQFTNASGDRFFLSIESKDPKFDLVATRAFLEALDPLGVSDIAA